MPTLLFKTLVHFTRGVTCTGLIGLEEDLALKIIAKFSSAKNFKPLAMASKIKKLAPATKTRLVKLFLISTFLLLS